MDKINKIIKSFEDVEVKITYVLSLMVKDNLISIEDKTEIKKGLQTSQQKFRKLASQVRYLNKFQEISQVLLLFLKESYKKFTEKEIFEESEVQIDISPETFDIMLFSDDTSPFDNALFHRKVRYGNNESNERYSIHLKS